MLGEVEHTDKVVILDAEAREALAKGVNVLANAVKVTLGPRGRNVVIERPGMTPILTKDGVTVARCINLKEKLPNLGVQIVKEAALRTAETAGDGTTTATVLAQAIFNEGLKFLSSKAASSEEIRRGIELAAHTVSNEVRRLAHEVKTHDVVQQVGTISANGEHEIGELVAQAVEAVGRDGAVTVEEARGFKTYLTVVDGMQIERGYLSPYFVTRSDKMDAVLDDPLVLLTSGKISSLKEILPLLESALEAGRSLLVVADDVEGEALQALVTNKIKGILKICAIKAPGFGESRWEMLQDLSVLLSGKVFSPSGNTLAEAKLSDLGTCRRVEVSRNNTIFISSDAGKTNTALTERLTMLSKRIDDPSIADTDRNSLKDRVSKLSGGIAVIHVGGATEVEVRERKDRIDDALHATQAALTEGIVPGGGVALIQASRVLDNMTGTAGEKLGIEILRKACNAPLLQIVKNAGGVAEVVLMQVQGLTPGQGYDASCGKFCDMLESGIVDPAKVVRSALENAASAASMLLTVGCVMVEDVV